MKNNDPLPKKDKKKLLDSTILGSKHIFSGFFNGGLIFMKHLEKTPQKVNNIQTLKLPRKEKLVVMGKEIGKTLMAGSIQGLVEAVNGFAQGMQIITQSLSEMTLES